MEWLSVSETPTTTSQLEEVTRIRQQLKQLENERRLTFTEEQYLRQDMYTQLEELDPDYDDMNDAEFDRARLNINPNYFNTTQELQEKFIQIRQEEDDLHLKLKTIQSPDKITVEKVDGKWIVVGGYYLDTNPGAYYFRYLFPENEVEATASFEDGTEGWCFYILKSDMY